MGGIVHRRVLGTALAAALAVALVVAGCGVLPEVGPELPEGFGEITVETARTPDSLSLTFPVTPPGGGLVFVCPSAPSSDASVGLMDRIRSIGCVELADEPGPLPLRRVLRFESLSSTQLLMLDDQERWFVILVAGGGDGGLDGQPYGTWVPGGPILP
ncbi:MAG TPA: hypothetical protein VFR14_13570 [Candidatus Limnocylindrales bacterium]|nr:hypothetical protein [Candidatus Limnocylindrales bacterium]